jgi:hypothetical protein
VETGLVWGRVFDPSTRVEDPPQAAEKVETLTPAAELAAEKIDNPCSAVEERAFRPAQVSWKEPGLQPLRSQFDAHEEISRNL